MGINLKQNCEEASCNVAASLHLLLWLTYPLDYPLYEASQARCYLLHKFPLQSDSRPVHMFGPFMECIVVGFVNCTDTITYHFQVLFFTQDHCKQ